MDTNLIVQEILANISSDVDTLINERGTLLAVGRELIAKNVAPILQMSDETQFFDVLTGLINAKFTDAYIENLVNAYVPFWDKPFEGMEIDKIRGIVFALVVKELRDLVDNYEGLTWFEKLQDCARSLGNFYNAK